MLQAHVMSQLVAERKISRSADSCHYAESRRLERVGFGQHQLGQATKGRSLYNERY
jgi:hypothetical protein